MIVAISCQGKFADVAESEAMQISLHPDDPPWGLLGSAINRTPVLRSSESSKISCQSINGIVKFKRASASWYSESSIWLSHDGLTNCPDLPTWPTWPTWLFWPTWPIAQAYQRRPPHLQITKTSSATFPPPSMQQAWLASVKTPKVHLELCKMTHQDKLCKMS